jgi:uncharacterized protein (DUF305 family)
MDRKDKLLKLSIIVLVGSIGIAISLAENAKSATDFIKLMHRSMGNMQKNMELVPMTGDPDRDFAAMMIPHHQGAIDMAKAELLYGQDRMLRRLAQQIIADQQAEIELMKLWIAKHPEARSSNPKR